MSRIYSRGFVGHTLRVWATTSRAYGPCARSCGTSAKPKDQPSTFSRKLPSASLGLRLALAAAGVVVLGLFGKHRKLECEKNPEKKANASSESIVSPVEKETPKKNLKKRRLKLIAAIDQARHLVQRVKDEVGAPGVVIAVSVDGKNVWSEGFGYADVENHVECRPETVMRIASISKSQTMTIVARLMEEGKLDIDKPVESYVPSWPRKMFNGKPVTITTRQLLSHVGGVRHYDKSCGRKDIDNETKKIDGQTTEANGKERKPNEASKKKNEVTDDEFELKEYLIKDHYETVTSSLCLFKDDALCSAPGSEFLYTTHGWTLVSAVVEAAAGQPFPTLVKQLFQDLGMKASYLDENDPIIYNRARYYTRDGRSRLRNVPYVDVSYKWAGGGFLSTALDLVIFGDVILYSHQYRDTLRDHPPGYLTAGSVDAMWTPVANTTCTWDKDGAMGLGWGVVPESLSRGRCKWRRFYASHTGGAVGASSALVVLPRRRDGDADVPPPHGVVVALITNLQGIGLNRVGLQIAELFDDAHL